VLHIEATMTSERSLPEGDSGAARQGRDAVRRAHADGRHAIDGMIDLSGPIESAVLPELSAASSR